MKTSTKRFELTQLSVKQSPNEKQKKIKVF